MRPPDGFLVFPSVSPAMTCVLSAILAALALAAHGEEHPIYTTVDPAKAARDEAEGNPQPPLHSSLFAPSPRVTIETGVRAMTAAVLELMDTSN